VGAANSPTGPSRLASLSSGDGRNRRLSCASTLPHCLRLLGGASTLARPLGALGRSLAGELDPCGIQRGHTRLRRAGPRDRGTPPMPDDGGNALVRWMSCSNSKR
jgi:hypothetical protein